MLMKLSMAKFLAVALVVASATVTIAGDEKSADPKTPPGSAEFQAAWKKHLAGDHDAIDAFAKILDDEEADKEDRFRSAYMLAVYGLQNGSPDTAIHMLDRAEKVLPGKPQVAIRRAEALLAKDQTQEAVEVLKDARKTAKKDKDLFYQHQMMLAKCEHKVGGTKAALGRLAKLCKKNPRRWEAFFLRGTLHEALDEPREAISMYEQTIALDPKSDPFPGIYAYQRHAALSISSSPSSYQNAKLCKDAIAKYDVFVERGPANGVSSSFVSEVANARDVLKSFGAGK